MSLFISHTRPRKFKIETEEKQNKKKKQLKIQELSKNTTESANNKFLLPCSCSRLSAKQRKELLVGTS